MTYRMTGYFLPCFELFGSAPADARAAIIGAAPVRVGIEAAVRQGLHPARDRKFNLLVLRQIQTGAHNLTIWPNRCHPQSRCQ